jgi:nucleotide-binding universal stress UspA family protein
MAAELREHRLAKVRWIISGLNRQFKSACKDSGVHYRVEQPEGDPYQCVADAARYHDVIVCGLGHLFEHGVVEEPPAELVNLVSRGVRPLVTVATEYRPIQRVLVAYSGSVESANALKRFVQLNLWPAATLRVVTFEHPREMAEVLLADALAYFRAHDLTAEAEHVPMSPHRNLLPYAQRWGADLIVMGNSHRNVLLRRIFGETMYDVLQTTDRPLFLAQ